MAERPLYTLYKNLKAQNYDVPNDYNKFESALTRDGKSGADNRHAIYENLKAQNFDVPDTYERFYTALFEPRSKTSSRAKGGSVPMSAADRARFLSGAAAISASAKQIANNDGRYNRLKQRKQKQQKDFGRVNLGTHLTPFGGDANNVVKDEFAYNPETGKAGAYVTSDNENAYTQSDAEQKQAILDKYGEEWNKAVDMGMVPSELDKADPGLSDTDVAMRQMERRQEWLDENQNRRSKELNESMHLQDSPFVASGGAVAPSSFNAAIGNEANRLSDAEYGAYNTAKAYNQMLRTTLLQELKEQKQRNENAGWWKDKWNDVSNYFGGMLDTMFDPKLYSQGVMDAAIASNLLQVKKGMEDGTIKKGSNAGNAAQVMLSAIQQQQGEAAKQQQYGTKAYQYGDVSGRSLKFMGDFALSGWRDVMTTGFTKAGEKVGEKMALGALGKWFTKNTGRVLGDMAGSAALAATNQLGSTYNNVIERYVGMNNENGGVTQDKDGDLSFNKGVSLGKAIKDGFGSATIENFSEMFGEYLPGASKLLSKLGLSKVSSFFEKIGNNAYYKWLSNATNKSGIQGVMAEISEEEFGTALHAAWGDGDGSWSDFNVFTNPDAREKQIDTCLGMFYSVGFMQSPRTAVGAINAVKYFNIKHQVTKADKFGQMMFNDKWDEIKNKIDVTTNADLTKTVLDATRSDSMTAKQKGAVINYAMFLSKLRGFNQASDAKTKDKVEEGETAPTLSNDLDDAYTEGHNADDADKHDIQIQHEDQAKTLAAALSISEQQLSGMSDEELESLTGQDDKLDQAIYDYQLSTARYQGVVDDAQDKVDLAAHQAEQRVNMYTDQSRGSVRNATIKASGGAEDYGVYIISGNIATHEDGSIDVSNSDDMILYFDPTTNSVEHADALMFAELGEELPADEVKAQAVADAKENAIKEVAGIIDGTVEVGSQFSVTDADGTEHTYEVLADNGDGTAMITIDGNVPTELVKGENVQIPYSFEDLQKMKDLEDQKRLEAAKIEREQMEKERAGQQTQETEQTEDSQPSFDFNQILNDNGNVVLVDVLGKDGNTKYPGSKLFLIRDAGAKAKVVELKSDGTLVPHAVNKEDVATISTMTLDEYKQAMPTSSMIEDNSGEIEGDRGGIEVNDELPPVPDNVTINGDGTYSVDGAVQGGENTTAPSEQTEQTPAITLEDGTIVPMLEDGNPDFSKLSAAQTAELYDTQFDEDADGIVSGYVSEAKKALDKANNMTVKGKTFVEQKAAKAAKEKAIADAQAAYDSAIAIRDAYNERQLAKEENTPEGRKSLIEKARRKFTRLKNSEEWSERTGDLWNETVGKLLHRLYDATGIDVFDDTPNTVYEYVAENVGPYSLNYEGNDNSKGVQQETGLSRSDFAKLGWLAAEGKGMTIDAKVHRLWENRPSNLESADTQEIRNALIGLITSGQTAFQARDYILNQRIELAESALEEQLRQEEDAAEAQKSKEEEEKKKAELEKKAEEEKTNENRNTPELSHEQQKAMEEGEKLGFPAVDKEGEPINQNVIELANWAKEQGLEIDPTSKSNSYADLYVMCKDGFGVSTLVPDVGEDINQVFYFPDNVQGEQLLKLQEEFNVGRDFKHSADMNSELTEGAMFYDGDTAREFKEFVDKKVEKQNKVFGEQRPEEDLPFSAKDNGQQQTTSERAADVEKNKVDDMKVVDNIVGQKTRKAFDRLAKMMGANIQWQYSDKLGNGWIQETTDADGNVHRTIFITLDSSITEGAQFIFGHEMTHQIKNLNPAAYNELTQLVLDTYGSDAFDKAVDETKKRYSDAGFSGRDRDYYAEEVVADAVGEMIRDLNLAHTLAMKMSHPLLAAIHEILQKIKLAFYGTEYSDVTKNIIRSIEQAYVMTAKGRVENSETGEDVSFSLRQKPEPKKKGVGYKVFVLKDGKLYPPMVANPDGAATPVGVWLDADAAPIAGESKTGRPQVKQGGRGTQGGSGKLAYRPGWHLGVVPYAIQFNRKDAEGNKTLFPKNFVFAEVEYAADVDYQEEARQEGINPSGKYQHSLAGLKHLPTDGYYMYRTNPNPETDPWVITGAMKVNRILTRAEQAELVKNAGREPQQIQEGDIVTDDVVNSINQEIADAPKFSLKVYHGSGADFTEFDFDHMGEGAGSQVFGWGGYVTSSKKIGKSYAKIGQMSAEDRHRHASSEDTPIEAAVGSILGQEIYNERAKTFKQKKAQAIENAENSIASYSDMLKNSNELDEKSKKFLEKSIERYKKELEVLRALTEEQYKEEYIKQGRAKNLYEVDIPDDNGSNYLDWENPLNEEQINAIRDALAKNGVDVSSWENRGFKLDLPFKDVYAAVLPMMMRCEPKEVSKFLSSLGFTGIKYPAGTIQGGAEEGDTNYVIFKPEDMKITQHTKFSLRLKAAIEETETNPSDAQKESGNYKKGHIKFGGYDYTIENPKGSTRSGKDANGKEWKVTMHDTYGYIRGKFGKDGDHLDMFINDKADLDNWNGDVFVVDQVNPDGSFDEHKVMYGYDSMDDAEKAYLANYSKGWQGLGNITGASKTEFDKWLDTSNRKLKPFAEYSKVKFSQAQSVNNEEPKTFEEFLNHPSLKFSIKNEEQRKAAENAYKYASELRPNKYAQYAIVDMSKPSKIPEYYEKKVLADNWRRFYNRAVHNELNDVRKKAWGNYKLFDLDRPFADQVNEVKGNVPDEFDAPDAATNKDNIKGLDRQVSSVAEPRYSLKDEKTLAGVHNITEEKLLKAIKNGGLANPSVAVIDSSKQNHEDYGDISLILPSEKVAKRTGKNAGTWQGDAWTPTYPQVERQMSNKGAEKASKDVSSVPGDMYREVRRGLDRWLDGGEANSAMAYMFLHEKGVAPEPKKIQHKFSEEVYNELKSITAGDFNIYGIGKADAQKVLDMYIDAKFDGDKDLYEEKTKAWLERNKSIVDAGDKGGMRYTIAKDNVELYDEYGFNYKSVQTFVRDVAYDHRKTGVDMNVTLNDVEDYIKTNNLTDEFDTWLEGKEKEYGIKEVIFDGFTPRGNRRYVPNTLENVSKIMKKQGRNGATGISVSFQNFAASLMPSYGTLKDIRSKKGLLTSDHEDLDKFKEKWSNVFFELGMKCQPDATGTFDDYGLARLSEAAKTSDPQAYLKKEYNVDFSDEDTKRLKEMVKAIKEEYPAMYFETKFERPVGFDEFSSAVVPTTVSNEVKQALQNVGVQIYEYDKEKEGDRSRAFNEAINSSDNIRFSLKSMMEKPEGWKQANKKAIHIAEAIERDPKFSLKNLDGTLIKAGTYFSGGGLVEEGLKGIIDPVVAVEYDEKISGVYRNNFGQHIVTADVRDVDPKELVKHIDGEVEYFHASPVCKNYSQAKSNHAEVELDKETAASTAEFINAIKPKVVTIENVKGYKDSEAMKTITDALDANGYTWDADVYNAADYGGYTNRERLIVRAVRDGKLPDKPKKMAHKSGWYEAVEDIIPTLTEKKNGVASWMDIRLKADGIDWRNIDKPLYVMGSAYADGKIPHAFADELLPTLRTKSGDVIVMPDGKVYRAIGRVLARVSGVSDDYKMPFSENLSHTIIGNGIPTQLTEHVIAPLLQNTLRPTTPDDGNTKFSLRYDQFEHDLNQWKKDNNLPKDAKRPTIPQRNAGESAVDFLKRVDEYRKQMALWKTAPTYEQHLLSDDTALGEFNRELQRGSVLKRIAFQDSMLAIRKAQEAIMKEVGVDRLNMAEDAYTAENRSHGKGKNEFEEYNNEFLQPLRKAYHQMKKVLGDSYDNVRLYMMAKHGLERNAQMAFKKSLEADYEDVAQRSAAYKAYKGDISRMGNDSGFELGLIDYATWVREDNAIKMKYSPSYMNYRYDKMGIAFDYSGLSALFDGSDFEEAAYKLVRDIEGKHIVETKELWDATNAATKKILRDGYKAGMMSEDTYQYVRDMYSHYIPLRGWDGTTADQVWDYIGGGKGAFNQTLKTANGRTSIADDPIAYIENMAESGILLNNKNWVKQHLMLLAQNHPTSLLTLSKAWYVKSTDANGNEEWTPATPQITSQMNSNQVKAAIDAFEQKMEQMEQTGDATQKRDGLNIAYPQTHSEEREHEVRVMKDGEEYVIYVNGDPQLAQAMNNTRAHRVREIQSGKLDRAAAWLGRKMAAAYTSLSPLFIPSNYFRDLTMTLASTAIREDGRYNYLLRKNLTTSWNLGFMLRDYKNGKLREKVNNGNATPKEQMFYDFLMNGGETGFVSSLDVDDLKKKFKNDLKDLNRWKANPVKVGHTIMDGIEFLNRAIEDSNRFAIYMTSIQYGRSIDEAVNDAKDVTLNFNRKGTGEYGWQMIRNLYLFINPAVQSLQTLGALVKHHPFKFTAVTASWLASGVLVPIVNAALMSLLGGDDDKDKYWQFTKWDRRNNLIMWVPFTHEYIKIPLAQEFRAFYGVGDMIASKMMGGELAEESWSQYAEDLLGQVVDMLPLDPTGYDGNIAVSLMPNPIRPVFELAFNVDFTGKPLFKETEYNKYDPNFTKAYVGTPDWLVRVSKMVNSIGNDYPDVQQNAIDAFGDPRYNLNNPAVVDHVLSSYLGGAYTMGSQVLGLLTKSLNDPKEIKMADIPLVSKFVSNPDDRPVTKKQGDEFWNMKENHDRAANTLSKLKKQAKVDGDYSMLERFYGSEEYKQYKQEDVKVKKYEEDKKKERVEESGEEYRPHKLNAEDIYKAHATPKDDFEDLKLKQLYTKLNGFKTSYDLLVDTAPGQSDGYYNTNKAAIDAIDEISLDKQEISELKKGFLEDGKDAYNAEDMKQIRELRKKVLAVLEKANKVVVANQKTKKK
jgi:site-specific DNA-cytosine methylase